MLHLTKRNGAKRREATCGYTRGVLTSSTWCFPPLSRYPDPRGTYSQSYWTGTRPIIIHPAAVDELNQGYQDLRDGKNIRGVIIH